MTLIPPRHRPGVREDERAFLEGYDPTAFPPVAVTVDVAVLTLREDELVVLLVERRQPPFEGHWALPGGFVRRDEDRNVKAAAERELREETRLDLSARGVRAEALDVYSARDRDPRMWVVSMAFVCMAPQLPEPEAGADAAQACFWPLPRLASPNGPWLAFDHHVIISDAVDWARRRLETHPLAVEFLEAPFTMAQLREVYEAVWGVRLDPANFRRKALSIPNFVVPSGSSAASPGGGRPAALFYPGSATHLDPPLRKPTSAEFQGLVS